MVFLLLLLAIPAAEIYLFIEVGGEIGAWPTIGLIFGSAIVGGMILRFQGLKTLANARREIEAQRPPVRELAHGAALAFAAMLLLTPGFITDALGALLLVPPLRHLLIKLVLLRIMAQRQAAERRQRGGGFGTIDADYEVVDEADEKNKASESPTLTDKR